MRQSKNKPWIYPILRLRFNVKWEDIAITYGKTVYCHKEMPDHLKEHEMVHVKQQKNVFFAFFWWILYLCSAKFRLSQELEAYRAQYQYICRHFSISKRLETARALANLLSGPMYGGLVTFAEADWMIRKP